MRKYLLLILTLPFLNACNNENEPPDYHTDDFTAEKIYEITGCKVTDASTIVVMRDVFIDNENSKYLLGAKKINDIPTFWFSKYNKDNGELIWEIIQAPPGIENNCSSAFNPVLLSDGNIAVGSSIHESDELIGNKEVRPVIINTTDGEPTFISVKSGYKFDIIIPCHDFFLTTISQRELQVDAKAYPWTCKITNKGEIILSAEYLNVPSIYNVFINDIEFISVTNESIRRAELTEETNKWNCNISLPDHNSYKAEIDIKEDLIEITYRLTLFDNSTQTLIYNVFLESGELYITINELEFEEKEFELEVNHTHKLNVTVKPEDSTNRELIWKSSDEEIAVVDKDGVVTGKKVGTCEITVASQTNEQIFDVCKLEIIPEKNNIVFDKQEITIIKKEEFQILYKLYPLGSSHSIYWESDDTSIATVDENGVIKGISFGQTRIKATINGGEAFAECIIHVKSIEELIYARFTQSSVISVGGYVTGSLSSTIFNNSNKMIKLTKLQILESETNKVEGEMTDENRLGELQSGDYRMIQVNLYNVYMPIFKWYYEFDGEQYTIYTFYE